MHAAKVMSNVVRHYPHEALDRVEEVSYLLKGCNGVKKDDYMKTCISKDYAMPSDDGVKKLTKDYIAESKNFWKPPEKKVDPDTGAEVEPEPVSSIGTMPDIVADSGVWKWAGVGFGEFEIMLLQKSMKALVASKSV